MYLGRKSRDRLRSLTPTTYPGRQPELSTRDFFRSCGHRHVSEFFNDAQWWILANQFFHTLSGRADVYEPQAIPEQDIPF